MEKTVWAMDERPNGSVEIQDTMNNNMPIAIMAYYPDGRHKETAAKIIRAVNHVPSKRNMYRQALDAQTACNLSGLCMSIKALADEIWEENKHNGNTNGFNKHPVMRLLAEQFYFLASGRDYSEAATICEEKAEPKE